MLKPQSILVFLNTFISKKKSESRRKDGKKDTMANMDTDKMCQCMNYESVPSSLHSHPCHSLFMSRVLYPVPKLWACP